MHTDLTVAGGADSTGTEERWAAWVARGAAHESRARKRALAAAAVVLSALGLGLAIARLLG
jgi:hypothetical protein